MCVGWYNWEREYFEQEQRDIRNARRRELYAMKKAQKQKDLALFTPSLESVIEESVHESRSTKPGIDRSPHGSGLKLG